MEELLFVKREALCGFCLDFGHAVCSGNAQKKNPYTFIKELMVLSPKMFHMSDLENVEALCDSHKHLGEGHLDIANLKRNFLPQNAIISIETEKNDTRRLDDFERDVLWLKHLN